MEEFEDGIHIFTKVPPIICGQLGRWDLHIYKSLFIQLLGDEVPNIIILGTLGFSKVFFNSYYRGWQGFF